MKLIALSGREINKNINRYRINWEKPSRSKFQFKVKQLLKVIWEGDIVFEEFPVFGCKLRVDFLNASKKVAVEANGSQHDAFNPFFHNNSRVEFLKSIKRDYLKVQWLEKNDFKLIEIIESDLKDKKVFYSKVII
jgi:hypothetical protein